MRPSRIHRGVSSVARDLAAKRADWLRAAARRLDGTRSLPTVPSSQRSTIMTCRFLASFVIAAFAFAGRVALAQSPDPDDSASSGEIVEAVSDPAEEVEDPTEEVEQQAGDASASDATPAPQPTKAALQLSLDQALRMAVESNLSVRLARLDNSMRQRDIVVARSAFDPFFNVSATYAKNRDPTVSFLDVGAGAQGVSVNPSESTSYSAGLSGTWVWGTTYQLQLGQAEFNRPAAAAGGISVLNPVTRTQAFLDLRQPLLKGAWRHVNTADLQIALNQLSWSYEAFEQSLVDVVFQVESAYWELAFASQNLVARRKALALSAENLDNARRKLTVGTFSENDVTTAESQWVLRKVELHDALLQVENSRDSLLDLVNYTGERSLKEAWEAAGEDVLDELQIECTSVPEDSELVLESNRALSEAFKYRPDYRQVLVELKSQRLRIDVAKNQLLPQVDLIGRWTQLGLEESYRRSYSSVGGGRFYDWLLGVEVSVPLSNRGPRATYRNVREEFRKLTIQKQDLENKIVYEIKRATRTIATQRDRVVDLTKQVELQRVLLDDERKQFEAGRTVAYTISTIENDLVNSETQLLRAEADLQAAKADFHRSTGTLLRRHRIWVERP